MGERGGGDDGVGVNKFRAKPLSVECSVPSTEKAGAFASEPTCGL